MLLLQDGRRLSTKVETILKNNYLQQCYRKVTRILTNQTYRYHEIKNRRHCFLTDMYYEFCICGISETWSHRHEINIIIHLQTIQVFVMLCIFPVLVYNTSLEATLCKCALNYFLVHSVVS